MGFEKPLQLILSEIISFDVLFDLRAQGIALLQGPRRGRFLMSEVPLCSANTNTASNNTLQGYLAHKKNRTPPKDGHRSLGMVLLQGPRGWRFLMSEVPLSRVRMGSGRRSRRASRRARGDALSLSLSLSLSLARARARALSRARSLARSFALSRAI